MKKYINRLRQEGLNLMIVKDNKPLFTSQKDGMRPLIEAINDLGLLKLKDTIVVDKIVGKAAALLISYFNAKEVHCITLSVRGREVLDRYGIVYYCTKLTSEIMNKLGTDICPFEKAVLNIEGLQKGYEIIYAKLNRREL